MFLELARAAEVTSFAAVPYTFDLLERVGFEHMNLPSLRYITQAGGRLDPDRVRSYAEMGQRQGWDLFVMYGQTEATARMAYLPPDQAAEHPHAIGVPVPGGSFRLEPVPGLDDCELATPAPTSCWVTPNGPRISPWAGHHGTSHRRPGPSRDRGPLRDRG